MPVMERRLQLLLDADRYRKIEGEAARSGRSVAAVIREAIDWRFDDDHAVRRQAAAELLRATVDAEGAEPEWQSVERAMDAELGASRW